MKDGPWRKEDDLGVMEDDLGAMEDDLGAMEDDLVVMTDDLEAMEDDLGKEKHVQISNWAAPGNPALVFLWWIFATY